ncbi:MAG: transposase, partial [Selenomonadaceae bacterium]|nr:transposase [Selenomonadaceae bacterium]
IQPYKSTAGNNQAAWRDLPPQFGNWNSIYHKFCQWCAPQFVRQDFIAGGYFFDHLRSSSSRIRATVGSSRGSKNSKVHVIINEKMQLMSISLTGGNVHDSEPVIDLFAGVNLDSAVIHF